MIEASRQEVRPRVFVSSVVKGFERFREAARRGIEEAQGEPVLVNEDFPALAGSARNACLDAIDSCDIYVALIGGRTGWETPSGKTVVEEEYERAQTKKLPMLVFVQEIEREQHAQSLVDRLSDYVDGSFRSSFGTPEELRAGVTEAVQRLIGLFQRPVMDKTRFQEILVRPHRIGDAATLRFVAAPERQEEVIDPLTLDAPDFIGRLYEIGHSKGVRLFDYHEPKTTSLGDRSRSLVLHQERQQRGDTINEVRLEIFDSGRVAMDLNVTDRVLRGDRHSLVNIMHIVKPDVAVILQSVFAFAGAFFDEVDPFKRHQRLYYNVCLSNVGHRTWVKEATEQNPYSMAMGGDDGPIVAFDEPRLITRSDLSSPDQEMRRILAMLQRKMEARR